MSASDWELRDFATGAASGDLRRGRWRSGLLLLLIVGLVASGLVWASWARIEEVAVAQGRVVPSGRAQTVENLEGGIVREIFVAEGDSVEAGDVLVSMDDTGAQAELGELGAQRQALLARTTRLEAEAAGAVALDFSATRVPQDGLLARREAALFRDRQAAYEGQREVLAAQVEQRTRQIEEIGTAQARVAEGLALIEEEIALLRDSGVVPRAQILPLQRERSVRLQEQDTLASRLLQSQAALAEAEARLREQSLTRQAEIAGELSEALNQLSVIEQSIRRAADVVARSDLRAPVAGAVSALNVNTIGAVIAPGEEVLRIVPVDERLLIEARARPEDISYMRPGLAAKVKLTAMDFTLFGSLEGEVTLVGADAETDEATGETYFPIRVETRDDALEYAGKVHAIRAGMVAQVDVMTGERTVLDYLLKPFRKARYEALRER